MNATLKKTVDLLGALRRSSQFKTSRNLTDVMADRIVQAATEPTLAGFAERLSALLDVATGYVGRDVAAAFLGACANPDAGSVLAWLRKYPRLAALLASLTSEQDYIQAMEGIEIAPPGGSAGKAPALPVPPIPITVTCLSPLAHGGDGKAGNATIFRRQDVLTDTGTVVSLPFYGGNALRGQMRDLLADHYLTALGFTPDRANPPCSLWWFYALYSGGKLSGKDDAAVSKAIDKLLGNNGAVRAEGIRALRNHCPPISILGTALGNRVLPGRIDVADIRPECREYGTGTAPAAERMEWTYLTRREDYENQTENTSMIAVTECLKTGTVLHGGIYPRTMTEVERGCLARGLALLAEAGHLGAANRLGQGLVRIDYTYDQGDADAYDKWLAENAANIREFLVGLDAMPAPFAAEAKPEAKEEDHARGDARQQLLDIF